MCSNCGYAYKTGVHYSFADGPLFYGVASCNGVALAMQAFLDELGIPNFVMTGYVTGTYGHVAHAWNEVLVGNNWYIVDATDKRKGDYSTYLVSNTRAYNGYSIDGLNAKYEFDWDSLYEKMDACLKAFEPAASSDQPLTFTPQEDGTWWVTDCQTGVTHVTIPARYEGAAVTGIGAEAFAGCARLEQIDIPEGIVSIGWRAFLNCIALETVTLPSTVRTLDRGAFFNCINLKQADLSVTEISGLNDAFFYGCLTLRELRLPDSFARASDLNLNAQGVLRNTVGAAYDLTIYGYSGGPAQAGAETYGHTFISLGQHQHVWDEGKITTRPAYDAEGVMTYTCTVCGDIRTETVPVLDPTPAPTATAASGRMGDVNNDGLVDRQDRVYLARALARWSGYAVPDLATGDVNDDGFVDRQDRVHLARYLAGWNGYSLP